MTTNPKCPALYSNSIPDLLSVSPIFGFSMMSLETARKAILFLLTLGCWKETLDKARGVIYTDIIEETDYRAE